MPRSREVDRGVEGDRGFDFGQAAVPRSRTTDPVESHEAARRLGASGAQRHRAMILDAIRAHPGRTAEGLEEPTGLHKSAIGKRLSELVQAGVIVRVGGSRGARFFVDVVEGVT